ncbi:hypothetical protein G7009_16130 [Pseudomonas capeferrum]|nr:hypothetical protein [Pseudomonas capeferrum]
MDIVVRIGEGDAWPAALGRRYIGAQRLVFCAAPRYLAEHGFPAAIAELETHHCIAYGQADGQVGPWFFKGRQPGDQERRVVHPRIAVGDGEGEVSATLEGYGIAQLPTWLVQRHLDEGRLVEVLPELATEGLPMNLVWLKAREALPKVSTLLDYLQERLAPHGRVG